MHEVAVERFQAVMPEEEAMMSRYLPCSLDSQLYHVIKVAFTRGQLAWVNVCPLEVCKPSLNGGSCLKVARTMLRYNSQVEILT